jgi:hypothetical protein
MKTLLILTLLLLFSGCEFDPLNDKKIEALERENLALQRAKLELEANRTSRMDAISLAYQNKEKLAQIAMQEKIAKIEQAKALEAIRIQKQLEKEQLALEQKQKLEQMRIDSELARAKNELRLKQTLIAMAALLFLIIAFFIYYYFKKRREDKLIAYRDNLEKYFRAKENESRVKIAEKILDTIASGKLAPEHEAKLIEVLHNEGKASPKEEPLLPEHSESDEQVQDAEIIDDETKK